MLALQAQSIEPHGKREAARVGGINFKTKPVSRAFRKSGFSLCHALLLLSAVIRAPLPWAIARSKAIQTACAQGALQHHPPQRSLPELEPSPLPHSRGSVALLEAEHVRVRSSCRPRRCRSHAPCQSPGQTEQQRLRHAAAWHQPSMICSQTACVRPLHPVGVLGSAGTYLK